MRISRYSLKMSLAILIVVGAASSGCASEDPKVVTHPPQQPRVLNNFVTELILAKDLDDNSEHVFTFDNPRKGWLFFRTRAWTGRSGALKVTLSPEQVTAQVTNLELISYKAGEKKTAEAMRYLPKGK